MRIREFVTGLAILLSGSMAHAQQPHSCASISDDDQRLACFDTAFPATPSASARSEDDFGQWDKSVKTSALTDEKTVILRLSSRNQLPARFQGSGPATLILRCMENTTSAYLIFNGHFMSDIQGKGRVEYRVDDAAMQRVSMKVSTNNEALGLWRGSVSIPWIKRLIGGETLIVRATPFSESPMTAEFDIGGLDNAVNELRQTCSW